MFLKAAIAFLTLPGIVAFLAPAVWVRLSHLSLHRPFGLMLVVFGEEPWLARTHGEMWQQYSRRVRRWL